MCVKIIEAQQAARIMRSLMMMIAPKYVGVFLMSILM
jgi:hypothetical protein